MKSLKLTALVFLLCLGACAHQQAPVEQAALPAVDVYLLPMSNFPEQWSGQLAQLLAQETGLRVKSSLRFAPLALAPMPESHQYAAEDILAQSLQVARGLPGVSPSTYFMVLTMSDINTKSRSFRFQFSFHDKSMNASVVSAARMLNFQGEEPRIDALAMQRLHKMTKRAVGEMKLGWVRTSDRRDVMFAPIMSIQDIDAMGLTHHEK